MADQEILNGEEKPAETMDVADVTDANKNDPTAQDEKEADGDSEQEVFVNNGLEKWLAAREAWCKRPSSDSDEQKHEEQHKHAVPVDVDGIIDVLFDPRWRGGAGKIKSPIPPRFPKNVPLPQMIDVLTDLWEAEGLDV